MNKIRFIIFIICFFLFTLSPIFVCAADKKEPTPKKLTQPVGPKVKLDGKEYDLQTLMMLISLQQKKIQDKTILDQVNKLKERNKNLLFLNALLAKVRLIKVENEEKNLPESALTTAEKPFLTQHKIKFPDKKTSLIAAIKTKIDSWNSDSQMDMIRLQSLMNKKNQTFEMMRNVLQKMNQSRESIIRNMR